MSKTCARSRQGVTGGRFRGLVPHDRRPSTRSRRRAVRAVADGAHACRQRVRGAGRPGSWRRRRAGRVVLRIEDLGRAALQARRTSTRCSATSSALGLTWDEGPVLPARPRGGLSRRPTTRSRRAGSCIPASARAADLHAASAPHRGEKPVYPGTCRGLSDCRARAARGGWSARLRRALAGVPTADVALHRPGAGPLLRRTSRATAATSSYAVRTGRSPTSWPWWWTTPSRA